MSLVLKFGGSSVADADCLRIVAERVRAALPEAPVVVLSAMGKTTNALFAAAQQSERGVVEDALTMLRELFGRHRDAAEQLFPRGVPVELVVELERRRDELELLLRGVHLLRELSPRSMDAIASAGERLSTLLFAHFLPTQDCPAELFDARNVLRTDANFGGAQPMLERVRSLCRERLLPRLAAGKAIVTQGYIGSTENGFTTTLGRGGSDYSAALLGAALGAREVQIWTDVEGVLTADPRVIPAARPIPELSFAEAAELAAFGAKVLHPATIQPAIEANVPVTVRHTQRPNGRFTVIRGHSRGANDDERPLTALASRGPISVLTLSSTRMFAQSGYLARVFEVFGRHGVSVDLVATAEVSVSLTVEADAPIELLTRELSSFATVQVAQKRAIVAAVGEGLKQRPGLVGRIFSALGEIQPEMISMGANEINLSMVVRQDLAQLALERLHRVFFEEHRT